MNHYLILKNAGLKRFSFSFHIMMSAFLWAILFISHPLPAQTPFRVSIPGTAFTLEKRDKPVVVDDVMEGRRFRGEAFAGIILRANLRMHPSSAAAHKLQRLIVHFRSSPQGPSLRSVELRNGTNVDFHIETHLIGDYTGKETVKPETVANVWAWREPITVSSQSVLRLEVQFPGGFDSPINPGEFIITAVELDFPLEVKASSDHIINKQPYRLSEDMTKPVASSAVPNGVIYALSNDNDLVWYNHTGREDGAFRWAAPVGKTVGKGWNFKQLFTGDDGVFYAITDSNDLLWYRQDGRMAAFSGQHRKAKKLVRGGTLNMYFPVAVVLSMLSHLAATCCGFVMTAGAMAATVGRQPKERKSVWDGTSRIYSLAVMA